MGFFGWVTVLLIGLKLVGYFPYSWWLVCAPLMVGFLWAIFLAGVVVCCAWYKETHGHGKSANGES